MWSKVVWFTQEVPRYSFIIWLSVKIDTQQEIKCVHILYGEKNETRDHLFFACPYSFTVWYALTHRLLGSQIDPDWSLTLNHLQRYRLSRLHPRQDALPNNYLPYMA